MLLDSLLQQMLHQLLVLFAEVVEVGNHGVQLGVLREGLDVLHGQGIVCAGGVNLSEEQGLVVVDARALPSI